MADTIRCPHCGALNRAEVEWCGQCYARLVEPEPEPEPEPERPTVPVAPPGSPPEVTGVDPDSGAGAPDATPQAIPESAIGTQRGAFKVTEEGVLWTCSRCEAENSIDDLVCDVCGAPFAETVLPKVERVPRDPGTATLISLFFPGAGHAYLGLWGQGIARAALSLWALFVVVVSILQRGETGSATIAFIFSLIALGLWGVTAHDTYREARFEEKDVILKGRMFLYLVLGMLMLLMILLTVSGLSARN